MSSYIRIAVRRPADFAVLHQALLQRECRSKVAVARPFGTYADVQHSIVESVKLVHIDELKPHEQHLPLRAGQLQRYIEELPIAVLPAIIVDSQHQVVIDGHHRLEVFRKCGMSVVPAIFLHYEHEDILVNFPGVKEEVTKEAVVDAAVHGPLLKPKSTQHMVRTKGGSLLPIIVLAPQIAELITEPSSRHRELASEE
eukprot:gnl/TRDRNA2_/TRDRNA2_155841_c1_seq1.p1 gnl/TRDRNA2_/TRDRNA2_155841_c1~~gnl/TRDRNA2_/TRDRNA2_155841_c1_seq1.p1  ORF type:complete len:227 (-),score=48.62 gnl/TRDRNA2_/TRDRNA2_155841_c1_seq1:111-704(-)